ncbi:MAG: leucyl aminopeptidase family protein, partial [Lysobacter sp.]
MNLPLGFTATAVEPLPLHVVDRATLADWRTAQAPAIGAWLDSLAFDGSPGTAVVWAGDDGQLA